MSLNKDCKDFFIGRVNVIFTSTYGCIREFFLTDSEIEKIKKTSTYTTYNQVSYTTKKMENGHYQQLPGDNKFINCMGFYNCGTEAFLTTKLVNHGLTVLVYNVGYNESPSDLITGISFYLHLLRKNAPNTKIAVFIRKLSSYFCGDSYNTKITYDTCSQKIKEKFPEIFDIIIGEFSYSQNLDIILESKIKIENLLKSFFSDNKNLIYFDDNEVKLLKFLFTDRSYKDVNILNRKTLESICKVKNIKNPNKFIEKIVEGGYFFNFNSRGIDNFYFKTDCGQSSIILILYKIFNGTSINYYNNLSKKYEFVNSVITSEYFLNSIPKRVMNKVKAIDRLILLLIRKLHLGRLLTKNLIYLRKFEYIDLKKEKIKFMHSISC